MNQSELFNYLEEKYIQYHSSEFIDSDPIQIPHQFTEKQDIEISGFLTATIAWGQRNTIIKNGQKLMDLMDRAPFEFIKNHQEEDLKSLQKFVHRTFNGEDLTFFVKSLQSIYNKHDTIESLFVPSSKSHNLKEGIYKFREAFFNVEHQSRSEKHVSNPLKNSACKRINMFLRWMVRKPDAGVDFGIWGNISTSLLSCPLDVHSGNVARKLGLLARTQNDWKAVEELDLNLRKMDAIDPVKYDFALFGIGVFEGLK